MDVNSNENATRMDAVAAAAAALQKQGRDSNEMLSSQEEVTGEERENYEEKQGMHQDEDEDDEGYGDEVNEYEEGEDGEGHDDDGEDEENEEGDIHEDEEGVEGEEDADMEMDEKHEQDAGPTEEEVHEKARTEEETKSEQSYSTRGRTPHTEVPVELPEPEALEDVVRARELVGTGASFLDSLTEEERRARTRFVPDVDGMHQLRKTEVKSDLALARSIVSTSAPSLTRKAKGKRSRVDNDAMDEEDDDGVEPSEDEKALDSMRIGTLTVDLGTTTFAVPSSAFVAPPPYQNGSSNGDCSEGREHSSVPSSRRWHNQTKSPLVVEAITAFNPPRPPESVGGKKKHRLLRWERRPADIEHDLLVYRRTVQRTREELHSAERERGKIETVSTHLRRHFLSHLGSLNEERAQLSLQYRAVQKECLKEADLLTSRTRNRGAGKANYIMKEVLSTLKARGAELSFRGIVMPRVDLESPISGLGGLSSASFSDWTRTTTHSSMQLAASWILPGDKVTTPYGDGIVVGILEACPLGITNSSTEDATDSAKRTTSSSPLVLLVSADQENGPAVAKNGLGNAALESDASKFVGLDASRDKGDKEDFGNPRLGQAGKECKLNTTASPRCCVQLPFGVGYFQVGCVSSKVNPATYSDAMLAQRWGYLRNTATVAAERLDIEGMMYALEIAEKLDGDELGNDETDPMDDDDGVQSAQSDNEKLANSRLLPFGAGLLPTSSGRGALLSSAPIADIECAFREIYDGHEELGKEANKGVPVLAKDWEDVCQERFTLKAEVRQLQNELFRQRRIRTLNERTFASTRERCMRIESLVAEMRSDLKTLKERLDDELVELGIGPEMAENLLKQYFHELDDTSSSPDGSRHHRLLSEDFGDTLVGGDDADYHRAEAKSNYQAAEHSSDEIDETGGPVTKRTKLSQ